jgi:ADP-ribosylglycohydrolase
VGALEAAAAEPPAEYARHMGWVLIALQNAFYQALHAETLEGGVVQTVMAGGDTDTNGAVAGALLGAVHGRAAIPPRWRRLVLSCRALPGTGRPRPRCLWPVDVEELAEALLGT